MPTTSEFDQAYERLNPAQKLAVDTIDGPVMVVAGPGTGKTQVLVTRIANILLKTDTKPYNILALTFTDSAAKNMRERLVKLIGKTGYYVQITTFHAFCAEVIRRHPEFFPIDRDSEPLTELERYELFRTIIQDLSLDALKPLNSPLFYIKEIMKSLSDLKRENVSPDRFAEIVENEYEITDELNKTARQRLEKAKAKNEELVLLYREYQKRLRANLRYDFDDMIGLVVEAFEAEELLLREYQENIHYFLVDEYQDTNAAQNKVVDLLAEFWGLQANIFVVGDPHQSIYRFQGASVENVLSFVDRYPKAQVITLATGYRCPQPVYTAAHSLILNNALTMLAESGTQESKALRQTLAQAVSQQLASVLVEADENTVCVEQFAAPSQTLELVFVAEEIKKLLQKGISSDEIAVLYRHNRDSASLQEVFEKWEIPYQVDGGINVLKTEAVRQFFQLLKVIAQVRSGVEDETLFEIMSYEWVDLDNVVVMKIVRAAGKHSRSILDVIQEGYDEFLKLSGTQEITEEEFDTCMLFYSKLLEWGSLDAQRVFTDWFATVMTETGYLEWVLNHELGAELLTNLNTLYRQVKLWVEQNHDFKLRHFLTAVQTMLDHNLPLVADDLRLRESAVQLTTVHKAKGQEWNYVFLVHFIDAKWGNVRTRELIPLPSGLLQNTDISKKERNEDERRLFYVALTRAKKKVTITYPRSIVSENSSKDAIASMFLEEIIDQAQSVPESLVEAFTNSSEEKVAQLLQPTALRTVSTSEKDFFNYLLKDYKLSVTALNTYLRSPVEFMHSYLLTVPKATAEPMAFGTAVHAALERLYREVFKNHRYPPIEEFLAIFNHCLQKQILTSENYQRRLRYGQDVLRRYYESLPLEPVEPIYLERHFGAGHSMTMLGDVPLTGRIDRVDWIDQIALTARVIDYKTGKARTEGEILGNTLSAGLTEREQNLPESIRGPYKRQLVFYKLLADLDPTFIPTVTQGVFDFVEPNKQTGKFVQRYFDLYDEEVEDLKALIVEVMTEIRGLAFLQ